MAAASSSASSNVAPGVISAAVLAKLKALNVLLPFQEKAVEFAIHRRQTGGTQLSAFRQPKGFVLADEMCVCHCKMCSDCFSPAGVLAKRARAWQSCGTCIATRCFYPHPPMNAKDRKRCSLYPNPRSRLGRTRYAWSCFALAHNTHTHTQGQTLPRPLRKALRLPFRRRQGPRHAATRRFPHLARPTHHPHHL